VGESGKVRHLFRERHVWGNKGRKDGFQDKREKADRVEIGCDVCVDGTKVAIQNFHDRLHKFDRTWNILRVIGE
jgi:hypothetical protein